MSSISLQNRFILLVEDEYLLADEILTGLSDAGAIVVGPAATVETAMNLTVDADSLDAAILDINLRDELVYPLADALTIRGVPFIFTTGYHASAIPARFRNVTRYHKPVGREQLMGAIADVVGAPE